MKYALSYINNPPEVEKLKKYQLDVDDFWWKDRFEDHDCAQKIGEIVDKGKITF